MLWVWKKEATKGDSLVEMMEKELELHLEPPMERYSVSELVTLKGSSKEEKLEQGWVSK